MTAVLRRFRTPSLWIGLIAIVLAGSGTAVASKLITGQQVANESLTGRDIKDKSLTKADFRGRVRGAKGRAGATGPAGAHGPAGPIGPAGPAGASGPAGATGASGEAGPTGPRGADGPPGLAGVHVVQGPSRSLAPGEFGAPPYAECGPGEVVIGTGFKGPFGAQTGGFVLSYSTFVAGFFVNNSSITVDAYVQAICATAASGQTVSATRTARHNEERFREDVARAEASLR